MLQVVPNPGDENHHDPARSLEIYWQIHASTLGALRELVREGSVLENFVWVDSQDLVGIDAEIRKQIGVWILGVQGESIEAERTIKQLPSDLRKIKLADVQQLRKGHFFVSWGEGTRQVYVQPRWMTAIEAQLVAMTGGTPRPAPKALKYSEDEMWREQAEKAQQDLEAIKAEFECFKADHLTALDALQQKINTKDSTIQDLQTMLERRPRRRKARTQCEPGYKCGK